MASFLFLLSGEEGSSLVLCFHQTDAAVFLPQLGLFNFPGWITGHIGKNKLSGPLISGQLSTCLLYTSRCV